MCASCATEGRLFGPCNRVSSIPISKVKKVDIHKSSPVVAKINHGVEADVLIKILVNPIS